MSRKERFESLRKGGKKSRRENREMRDVREVSHSKQVFNGKFFKGKTKRKDSRLIMTMLSCLYPANTTHVPKKRMR